MRIGKTNAIFGGGVVYNFVPFVAPESFTDPRKYADYGLTVNLYEKFRVYKMTWAGADIAVEFSDEIASVVFTTAQAGSGTTIEVFETVSGVEISTLIVNAIGTHTFTSGSTKRYMIRRIASVAGFALPVGSVWAYCFGITGLAGYNNAANPYLKYVFFYENTLTILGSFRNTAITGVLKINGGVTLISKQSFFQCANITKVITGDSVTTINGGDYSGAFQQCTSLQIADLGTGLTSIGTDTFRDCTSLVPIICRAYTGKNSTSQYGIMGTHPFAMALNCSRWKSKTYFADKIEYENSFGRKITLSTESNVFDRFTFLELSQYQATTLRWISDMQTFTINGITYQRVSDWEVISDENTELVDMAADFARADYSEFSSSAGTFSMPDSGQASETPIILDFLNRIKRINYGITLTPKI